jgi:hypothetical protein
MTDQITEQDALEPVAAATKRRKSVADGNDRVDSKSARKIKIIIPKTQTEKNDVYVAVNGTDFLIRRGVEVEVPDFILHVLNDSVERRLDPDGKTWIDVQCYPYQVVGGS